MKIAINLSLNVQMVAFSEGVLIAEKGGIDREVAVEAMLDSVIASPMLGVPRPRSSSSSRRRRGSTAT